MVIFGCDIFCSSRGCCLNYLNRSAVYRDFFPAFCLGSHIHKLFSCEVVNEPNHGNGGFALVFGTFYFQKAECESWMLRKNQAFADALSVSFGKQLFFE